MGRDNNNAGIHMLYWPKHKDEHDDFEDDYVYINTSKRYNTLEYQKRMDEAILNSVMRYGGKHTFLCDCYGQYKRCSCGGVLKYRENLYVHYGFEGGFGFRGVPGLKCENCKNVYFVKGDILPLLKYNFHF